MVTMKREMLLFIFFCLLGTCAAYGQDVLEDLPYTAMIDADSTTWTTDETATVIAEDTVAVIAEDTVAAIAEDTVAVIAEDTVAVIAEDTVAAIAEDTVAVIAEDTVAVIVEDTATMVTPINIDYEWGYLRETRDSMRYQIRYARDMYREEVKNLRDSVRAELYAQIDSVPHEIRIGCGDAIFESIIWCEKPYPTIWPEDYTEVYAENYRYTQHCFVEYMYNVNYWYSVGGMVDYSGVLWDEVTRDGKGMELQREVNQQFHNIVIMPVIRFAYLHTEYVSLYSALGLGVNVNTGTEIDYKGRKTAASVAANISLLGVRIGGKHFFGALELGGMFALANTNEIYMLGSRLFTASIGCRF